MDPYGRSLTLSGDVLEAGCNAHRRRKFEDAEATQPVLAAEGGAFVGAMYGEEEKARKLGLSGDALREHRQRFIRPIALDFERWLAAVAPTLLPSEPLAAAIGYYSIGYYCCHARWLMGERSA